jgi:hypothetical protein
MDFTIHQIKGFKNNNFLHLNFTHFKITNLIMQKKFQNFKSQLFAPRIDKISLFNQLRIDYTFDEQEYIIKRIPKTFDSLLYGKALYKDTVGYGKKTTNYLVDQKSEINWMMHQFNKYSEEIFFFLKQKERFEHQFLHGNYEASSEILELIKKVSFSYWGLENKFLQVQYEKGLEYNFKLLNSCKSKKVDDPSFFLMIHFFSYKVEEDVSYFSYQNAFESSLSRGFNKHYDEYFKYRLSPFTYNFNSFESVLWVTNSLSLFDKYLVFRDFLFNSLLDQQKDQQKDFAKKHSINLLTKINDALIHKSTTLDGDFTAIKSMENVSKELIIIDLFTVGDYSKVICESKILLSEKITFSIIELYVKAHIHLNIPLENFCSNESILFSIITQVYNYLNRNEKSNEALIDLLTISNSISSFDISNEIVSFIHLNFTFSTSNVSNFGSQQSYLYCNGINPIHFSIFKEKDTQIRYLKLFSEYNSVTVNFFMDIINGSDTLNKNYLNIIPQPRLAYYKAEYLFNIQKYDDCMLELLSLNMIPNTVNYLKELYIKMLFDCYFNLSLFDEAIELYVNSFILNSSFIIKINAKKLSDAIIANRWKNVSHDSINFPIFINLVHDETHPKYIAYDLYMRKLNITHPSHLIGENSSASKEQIYFLKNVANQKIISRKVMVFQNSNSVLNERISICQILAKVDNTRIIEYNKEISEITKRLTVQHRIKEIDQSKIYVDEYGILDSELIDIKKGFNRFKSISELLKLNKIDATGIGYDALYDLLQGKIDTDAYKKSLRKTDLHFELFIQLFLEIRDKFLFSNQYGLDYYLSQRIRHGTIIGQIRKSFKAFNLVTTKSSENGCYLQNDHWNNIRLEISHEHQFEFDKRMNDFSTSIDKIINELKDQFIQIKTEDIKTNQKGWFDYSYIPLWNSEWLYSLFIKEIQFYTDFNEFVKSIFEILWEITDRNLNQVRLSIDYKIKGELIGELDCLEVDLKQIIPTISSSSIFRAIADCRTNVQADVDYIIRWFNKSKNDEIDFLIEDALNTSLTIVNNIINPTIFNIEQNINAETLIKGVYFPHFVDLIKIFLTNIYDYYKNNNLMHDRAFVNVKILDNFLFIEFVNDLSDNVDLLELRSKIDKINLDLEETNYMGLRGEGNTGFSKANNILKNVFRNQANRLNFEINDKIFKITCEVSLNNLLV